MKTTNLALVDIPRARLVQSVLFILMCGKETNNNNNHHNNSNNNHNNNTSAGAVGDDSVSSSSSGQGLGASLANGQGLGTSPSPRFPSPSKRTKKTAEANVKLAPVAVRRSVITPSGLPLPLSQGVLSAQRPGLVVTGQGPGLAPGSCGYEGDGDEDEDDGNVTPPQISESSANRGADVSGMGSDRLLELLKRNRQGGNRPPSPQKPEIDLRDPTTSISTPKVRYIVVLCSVVTLNHSISMSVTGVYNYPMSLTF